MCKHFSRHKRTYR